MSLDETDARLARLDWSPEQRLALVKAVAETGVRVPSMCLSAHRRFPLGSEDDAVRHQGLEIMRKAIRLAQDVGIRVIQRQATTSITSRRTMRRAAAFATA